MKYVILLDTCNMRLKLISDMNIVFHPVSLYFRDNKSEKYFGSGIHAQWIDIYIKDTGARQQHIRVFQYGASVADLPEVSQAEKGRVLSRQHV